MLEKKVEFNLRVAMVLLLPLFIFSYLALSSVFTNAQNNIEASVAVAPVTHIECVPNTLVVGSSAQWINCFIKFDDADVNDIDFSTVKLSISSNLACGVFADSAHFITADGRAFVRFSRSAMDLNCFHPPPSTPQFTLVLSGFLLNDLPFSGTDSLLYITTCQNAHVHQLQANTTTTSGQINTLSGQSFDLSAYSPRTYSLNGFFDCRNGRIIGEMKFFTKGTITEHITIFNYRLPRVFDKKRPIQISVIFTTMDNCVADSATHFECTGKGLLFFDKEQPFSRERIELQNLRVEVTNGKGTIQGGDVFNDKVDISNLVVSKVTIRPSIPKI